MNDDTPVKTWWWTGIPNFGDRLTEHIMARFTGLTVEWAPLDEARLVAIGSVLDRIPPAFDGTILGAGRMFENGPVQVGRANIKALRGPLSARGIRGDYALGDLGLLAPDLIGPVSKEHRLGIVPHWSDVDRLSTDPRFTRYAPLVIDPRNEPLEVVRAIASCHKIVTSSLHGMIVADAYDIPRRVEHAPRLDREGGWFKFRDYSQSIHMPFELGVLMKASRFRIESVQHELYDVLQDYEASQ